MRIEPWANCRKKQYYGRDLILQKVSEAIVREDTCLIRGMIHHAFTNMM